MYKELLEKLFSAFPMYHKQGTSAYKEGLENIVTLADMASHPEKKFQSIHIAGTNGKGSVAHLLASLFQEAGYKTGLFTSPHLVNFNERIKINGIPIAEEEVIRFFNRYQSDLDRIEPSFFEMTTILAFSYFAEKKVDIAIVEVGLGGRLDATNIITPLLSVITNISKDHTQLLGNSISTIAYEKGGIIKSGIPVVIGETNNESEPVFREIAANQNAPIFFADQRYKVFKSDNNTEDGLISMAKDDRVIVENIPTILQGDYQLKNLATFYQCVELLRKQFQFPVGNTEKSIQHIYQNTGLSGRWQIVDHHPLTICDVGHNIGAFELTIKQLIQLNRKIHFVFGMVNDKDIEAVLGLFPERDFIYYCCRAENDRSLSPEILDEKLRNKGLQTILSDSVPNAWIKAKKEASPEDVIFIGGSCFVVGDFLGIKR